MKWNICVFQKYVENKCTLEDGTRDKVYAELFKWGYSWYDNYYILVYDEKKQHRYLGHIKDIDAEENWR
jgi:hypothetical protein